MYYVRIMSVLVEEEGEGEGQWCNTVPQLERISVIRFPCDERLVM